MNHEQAQVLVTAYVDKELSISETVAFEQHLNDCIECQSEYKNQLAINELIKHNAEYFSATPQFIKQLKTILPEPASIKEPSKVWHFSWRIPSFSTSALMASMVAIIWSTAIYLAVPTAQDRVISELISSHVRSMQVDHLSDVISTDKHTVKPWFNGKLDFSPEVTDFATQGFPLEGGRLDYINGKTVAAIVYRYKKHPINVYIWPSNNKDLVAQKSNSHGYHLIHWITAGMEYWAVSDLAADELMIFANILKNEETLKS
ncbi:MAG TPA: anti-sigma factor [Methyloradius sp.]